MGRSTGLSLLLLLALQCADAQRSPEWEVSRAANGTDCWYPNYYCSVTEDNTQTPVVVTGGADTCHTKCADDSTCSFFTWFKRRGVEYCYLLTECGPDYRIYDDWCLQRDTCKSGPSDCLTITTDNARCNELVAQPGEMEWQCENGGTGLIANGYNATLNTGARCMLSCASWISSRWASKSNTTYGASLPKGFLFSTCQANGTWTDVLPNDFEDEETELEWPKPSNLAISAYPKPDVGSLFCGCSDLVLVWPPLSMSQAGTKFYYNPRDEAGATMECEDEVQNSLVVSTQEFRIASNNTCRFLCDDYLVATVKCVDGKWTGEKDQGFWCYDQPTEAKKLKDFVALTGTDYAQRIIRI